MSIEPYNPANSPSNLSLAEAVTYRLGKSGLGEDAGNYSVSEIVERGRRSARALAIGVLCVAGTGFAAHVATEQTSAASTSKAPAPLVQPPNPLGITRGEHLTITPNMVPSK